VLAAEDGNGVEAGFPGNVDKSDAEVGGRRCRRGRLLPEERQRAGEGENIREGKNECRAAEGLEEFST